MSYSIRSCDSGIVDQIEGIEGDEAFVIWLYFGKSNFPTDCVILKVTLEFLAPIVHLWVTILLQFLDVEEPQGGELHNFIVIDDMILNIIKNRLECLLMSSSLVNLLCVKVADLGSLLCMNVIIILGVE